jgi:hypothetical protein
MQAISPNEYAGIIYLCERYCDLWVDFWDTQMLILEQQVKEKVIA